MPEMMAVMANHQRRTVLKMAAYGSAVPTAGTVLGTAQATETVSISGTVVTVDGKPATDVTMEASVNDHPRATTDAQGRFSMDVASNSQFYLGLYESKIDSSAPKRDGIPFMYDFGEYSVTDTDIDLGTLTLPNSYVVELQVLDENGEPAPSAEPDIAAKSDGHWFGAGPSKTYLTEDGFLKLDDADQPGVEIGGPILLSVEFRDAGATYKQSFTITEPTDLVVQAGEGFREASFSSTSETTATTTHTTTATPSETTETTTTTHTTTATTPPSTSNTSTDTVSPTTSQLTEMGVSREETMTATDSTPYVKRGFFSNGEAAGDYEFLSNPFFLTVGGFILSVAGIAHNLIQGK